MRPILFTITIIGLVVFGSLFSFTFGVPDVVDLGARKFVKRQIEEELKNKYSEMSESSIGKNAIKLAGKLGYEEQKLQNDMQNKLPQKIAEIISSLCGYDCEKKKLLENSITSGYLERISKIKFAQKTLDQIIKDKYFQVIGGLLTDLRIFLGTNCFMFLILLIISQLKPKTIQHLFLPCVLLVVSVIGASAIYIFGQDWFYTIIYNNYTGFGYLAYIGIIFCFLLDIVFNGASITTELLNAFFQAIGSSISLLPC